MHAVESIMRVFHDLNSIPDALIYVVDVVVGRIYKSTA